MFVFLCQLVDRLTPWKIERQTTQALLFDTPPVFSYVALLKTKQCYFSKMKIVGYYLEGSVAAFEIYTNNLTTICVLDIIRSP